MEQLSSPSPVRAGRYLNLPNLLSASRLPLAFAFSLTLDRPVIALSIVVVAALSDMLDGMIARRRHESSQLGAIVDPIFDKLFVVIAVAALVITGRLSLPMLALIITRDILMVPMLLALPLASRQTRSSLTMRSNVFGKITTVAQFSALIAAMLLPELVFPLAVLSCALGVLCIISYSRRGYREAYGSANS